MALLIPKEDAFPAKLASLSRLSVLAPKIRKKLTADQLQKFRSTAVGHLLDIDESLNWASVIVHGLLLRKVDCTDVANRSCSSFLVGERILQFTKEQFAVITGLNFGDLPQDITLTNKNTPLLAKYRHGSKALLEATFESCYDESDMFQLALVMFVECCLLGSEPHTLINRQYLHLVEDLDKFNAFPWGSVVYEKTNCSIYRAWRPDLKRKKQKNGGRTATRNNTIVNNPSAKKPVFHIQGFPSALQVWAYETFGALTENGHCHLRSAAAFPRINRWRSGTKAIFSKVMEDLYANTTAVTTRITPSAEEIQKLKWNFPPPAAELEDGQNGRATEKAFTSTVGQNVCLEDTIQGLLKEMKQIKEENSQRREDNRALNERLERCEQKFKQAMDCMKDSQTTLQNFVLKFAMEVGWSQSGKSKSAADAYCGPSMDAEFVNKDPYCSPEIGRINKSRDTGLGLFGSQSKDLGFVGMKSAADTFVTQGPFYVPFAAFRPKDAVKRSSVQLHELPQSSFMAEDVTTDEAVSCQPAQPQTRPPALAISGLLKAPVLTSSTSDARVATKICKLLFTYLADLPERGETDVVCEVKEDGTILVGGDSEKTRRKGQRKQILSKSLSSPYISTAKRLNPSSFVFDPSSDIPMEDLDKLAHLTTLFTDKSTQMELEYCTVTPNFFMPLLKPNGWLKDDNMDFGLFLLRKRQSMYDSVGGRGWTTTTAYFSIYLGHKGNGGPGTRNSGPKPGTHNREQIEKFIQGKTRMPYGRPWSEVQTVYNVHNMFSTHWVGLAIHLDRQEITVYDSMMDLYKDSVLHAELQPYSDELPKILNEMGFYDSYKHAQVDTENAKKSKGWPITRCPDVPQQPDGDACGLFVLKSIECSSAGCPIPPDMASNICFHRLRLASECMQAACY